MIPVQDSRRRAGHGLRWKIPVLLAIALGLGFAGYTWWMHSRIAAARDALRQAGLPVTTQAFDQWYAMPDGVNGADAYVEAFALLREDHELEQQLPYLGAAIPPSFGQPLPESWAAACEAYLALNEPALQRIIEAPDVPCRYSFFFRDSNDPRLPHIGDLRKACRLLLLRAHLCESRGDREGAMRSIEAIVGLARSLRDEPVAISQLTALSLIEAAEEAAQDMMEAVPLNEQALGRLIQMLAGVDFDRAVYLLTIHGSIMIDQGYDDPDNCGCAGQERRLFYRDWDQLHAQQMMLTVVRYAKQPSWPVPDFGAMGEAMPGKLHGAICWGSTYQLLITNVYAAQARQHAVITALAAQQYRAMHGRLPTSLNDLTSVVPATFLQDPLAPGQQLTVVEAPFGLIIYSIGADGVDNGGRRFNDWGAERLEGTDIVAYVFREPGQSHPELEQRPESSR